jgi:alpha-beta hydrolase superfamily lysophospholipase
MTGHKILSFDNYPVHIYEENEIKNPKAVVQIIHGMGEHAKRYENVVNFLVKNGFIVFASDHRAHGNTAKNIKDIGKYKGDVFYDTLRDQIYFSEYLKDKYKLPLITIGHSFGSFVAQRYHQLYNKHDALVLIGSCYYKNSPEIILGKTIASLGALTFGKSSPAKIINMLTFKRYNNQFEDKHWLTSDKEEQRKQKVDRFCSRTFSNNFYKHFFSGILDTFKRKNVSKINTKTPILIMSGKKDPLSKNGEKATKLAEFYKQYNVNKVRLKIYEDARHELLNEVNRQTVYKDLLKFIQNNVKL